MKLVVLDPGHFHAALLQKTMYRDVDATVHVYAQQGPELDDYLHRIDGYNTRSENPTAWRMNVRAGPDFLERFSAERAGDVVVICGNNRRKSEFITRAVDAGMHVLADKPMAIDAPGFDALRRAFALAERKGVLLYDIMTERYEITTILQAALSRVPSVYGEQLRGSEREPAVVKESVHHFSKLVSGVPIKRPAWFFDTAQQGEGLVDITTHLVDLVQWACFPEQILDFERDVRILGARRWPTPISPAQFSAVTRMPGFPGDLRKDVRPDGRLHAYANGEIDYCIKGVHARVRVLWHFEAPPGAGDTHYSVMRGSQASLTIRQGAAEGWQPALYVEPVGAANGDFAPALKRAIESLSIEFPGIGVEPSGTAWRVVVPASYHVGHEAHFAQVASRFLDCVAARELPDWEVPNMIAKYATTTRALAMARGAPAHDE